MKLRPIIPCLLLIMFVLSGCSSNAEVEALEKEIQELKETIAELTDSSATSSPLSVSSENTDVDTAEDPLSKIEVSLTGKTQLPKDLDSNRYSNHVLFNFSVFNHFDKDIKGIQGNACFSDMFGSPIITIKVDFTDIMLSRCITRVDDLGFEVNQFMDDHMKLYTTDFENLKFEYTPTMVIFTDGSSNP